MNVMELKGVVKQIGDFTLGPIDLEIPTGSTCAIIGDNGSGKSTLLKLILGLAKENEGKIHLFGSERIHSDDRWRSRVAYQSQTLKGCDRLTGRDLEKLISKFSSSFKHTSFRQYVRELDIPLNKPIINLSEGVHKKLNVALTLAQDSELTIFDEPTAHMDIHAQKFVISEMVRQLEEDSSKTILFASHQLDDIRKLADYLLFIRKGVFLGMVEKDELSSMFIRYWVDTLPHEKVPGTVMQGKQGHELVSIDKKHTENALEKAGIKVIQKTKVELDDIIPWILSGEVQLKKSPVFN
ncbi:hypothetical protein GCM10008967_17510 [Bacillus carboniphilus]|uniref:ABC transporter domain-containing protein n=1 Tax=Bacillus carboniphilus TaxID=86663 RepID=A0ABN0W734_9BACI